MTRLREALNEFDMWELDRLSEIGPLSWRDLVDMLKGKGLTGPYTGAKHPYMDAKGRRVIIPNTHHGEVFSRGLVSRISRQADMALAGAY